MQDWPDNFRRTFGWRRFRGKASGGFCLDITSACTLSKPASLFSLLSLSSMTTACIGIALRLASMAHTTMNAALIDAELGNTALLKPQLGHHCAVRVLNSCILAFLSDIWCFRRTIASLGFCTRVPPEQVSFISTKRPPAAASGRLHWCKAAPLLGSLQALGRRRAANDAGGTAMGALL